MTTPYLTPAEADARGLQTDRKWVVDAAVTCLNCQRAKNRETCRCGDPTPPRGAK